jgi:hypothetical protein
MAQCLPVRPYRRGFDVIHSALNGGPEPAAVQGLTQANKASESMTDINWYQQMVIGYMAY